MAFEPHRGDDVEAWVKRWRDCARPNSMVWYALDGLLDDYRLHADTGTPLAEDVPDPEAVAPDHGQAITSSGQDCPERKGT